MYQQSLLAVDEITQSFLGVFSLQWSRVYRRGVLDGLNGQYVSTGNLFVAASRLRWFGFEKRYFVADSTAEAISDAVISSSWIPLITAPLFQPLYRIGGYLYGDGFWSGKDIVDRRKTIIIHPRTFERMSINNYWLWLDKDRLVALYELGQAHAAVGDSVFCLLPKLPKIGSKD